MVGQDTACIRDLLGPEAARRGARCPCSKCSTDLREPTGNTRIPETSPRSWRLERIAGAPDARKAAANDRD